MEGDSRAISLNDILQYLGFLAFRPPVPAYKHSAAQFLKLRKWLECDSTFPGSPTRPSSDIEILREVLASMTPYIRCDAYSNLNDDASLRRATS